MSHLKKIKHLVPDCFVVKYEKNENTKKSDFFFNLNYKENFSEKTLKLKENLMKIAKKEHFEFLKNLKNNTESNIIEGKVIKWHSKFIPSEIPEDNFSLLENKKNQHETIFDYINKKAQKKLEIHNKIFEISEKNNHEKNLIENKSGLSNKLYLMVKFN